MHKKMCGKMRMEREKAEANVMAEMRDPTALQDTIQTMHRVRGSYDYHFGTRDNVTREGRVAREMLHDRLPGASLRQRMNGLWDVSHAGIERIMVSILGEEMGNRFANKLVEQAKEQGTRLDVDSLRGLFKAIQNDPTDGFLASLDNVDPVYQLRRWIMVHTTDEVSQTRRRIYHVVMDYVGNGLEMRDDFEKMVREHLQL